MSKVVGFYLLEVYFQKYQCWPISHGLRGFGPTILISINALLMMYPLLMEIQNYKKDFDLLLFRMQFVSPGLLLIICNIQLHRHRRHLFEMLNLLSDFNKFGIPTKTKFTDKILKISLKVIYHGGFLITFLISHIFMLNEKCKNFKSTKHCLILDYWFPFHLEHWEITLMILFQMYTMEFTLNVLLFLVLLAWYVQENIALRIETLKQTVDNINLTRNRKRNFNTLRNIVLYHQHMCRMYEVCKNFFTTFLVPTKMLLFISLTISTTEFVLQKDIVSFSLVALAFLSLFIVHTIGQKGTTAAGTVAESIYDLNWYDADVSTRRDILNLLCLTQKVVAIELPLFGKMSHAAAAKEYKAVYVFYNWVLTMTKKGYI